MKSTIPFLIMLMALLPCACKNNKTSISSPVEDSILMKLHINNMPTKFEKYRSFDEYKLKGVGIPEEGKEFVEVARNDSCIIVRRSYLPDSIITYKYADGCWTNVIVRLWEKRNMPLIKDVYAEPATIYYRILGNDSIIEYCYTQIQETIIKEIYIKCKDNCVWISIFPNEISNVTNPFPELIALIKKYNVEPDILLKEVDNKGNKRAFIKYRKELSANKLTYTCGEKDHSKVTGHYYVFNIGNLGEFGIQPGFEKYNRELSWCRDIIESKPQFLRQQ